MDIYALPVMLSFFGKDYFLLQKHIMAILSVFHSTQVFFAVCLASNLSNYYILIIDILSEFQKQRLLMLKIRIITLQRIRK